MPIPKKTTQLLLRLTPAERAEIKQAADGYPQILADRSQRRLSYTENYGSVAAYLLDLHRRHLASVTKED